MASTMLLSVTSRFPKSSLLQVTLSVSKKPTRSGLTISTCQVTRTTGRTCTFPPLTHTAPAAVSEADGFFGSYDGLIDITHGCTGVTVSNSKLHDHFKASLVGHSDNNKSEDTKITVTYVGNYFLNLNSRAPSFRFGTGHVVNNLFEKVNDGVNTRQG